ncbi:hypothetical protein ATZ36_02780 [Candidatus Endomicrobiellum trichonymphae]|uniref:DUF805 domain-containing protein n=1 Tax=Endomicrobium trichonymphae TaxID=1408204 RepID=A0A1E5ILY1_ENDTX|nr:hypothetical protein ATZ36_02780 [Candidatus Endomicrobium trichonymphae]
MVKFLKIYFWDVISNHYVDFDGRASLAQFWYFMLINFVLKFVWVFFYKFVFIGCIASIFDFLMDAILILPSISIVTRRLHDTNRSGWFQLIELIPFIGCIILIILLVLGPVDPNRFDDERI